MHEVCRHTYTAVSCHIWMHADISKHVTVRSKSSSRSVCNIPLQKRANGIPLITIEYHSVSFSTIGPFNDISAGFSGTLNGNLKHHSIPLNGTKNPKYHSKYHSKYRSDTIQIHLAIIPPGSFKYHSNTIQKPMVLEWYECYFLVRASRHAQSQRPT